ncbi:hypothetical protein BCR43DRAFT_495536 [Syncephalastrum racemosum]|uniref:SET domain-containing protein n=1 Tax=Syncephalastrum racemosum TaxID=13706 RepID=A0A1X2H5Z9_SYNRA|nr:hypothetical protein BCR43DRAFT_495536 [Syncephalastrum racemosum]
MDTFLKWSKDQGVECSLVQVKPDSYGGYGLFATTTIEPDSQPVLRIPNHLVIDAQRTLDDPGLAELLGQLLPPGPVEEILTNPALQRLALRLFLVYHREKATSFWKPYLDCVPDLSHMKKHHLFFRTDLDACYDGTSVALAVNSKREQLEREHARISGCAPWLTLEQWTWAECVFNTRVVDLDENQDDERYALVPFFDFANHSSDPTIRWRWGQDSLDFVTFDDQTESIAPDTQVCISYGQKSNQELLYMYGFSLPDNHAPARVVMEHVDLFEVREFDLHNSWDIAHLCFIQSQAELLPPITYFSPPKEDESHMDPPHTVFSNTGWTFAALVFMYLAALDSETVTYYADLPHRGGRVALHTLQNLDADELADTPVLADIGGELCHDLQDALLAIVKLPQLPRIQHRVCSLLVDMAHYHINRIDAALGKMKGEDDALYSSLRIYCSDERRLLDDAARLTQERQSTLVV